MQHRSIHYTCSSTAALPMLYMCWQYVLPGNVPAPPPSPLTLCRAPQHHHQQRALRPLLIRDGYSCCLQHLTGASMQPTQGTRRIFCRPQDQLAHLQWSSQMSCNKLPHVTTHRPAANGVVFCRQAEGVPCAVHPGPPSLCMPVQPCTFWTPHPCLMIYPSVDRTRYPPALTAVSHGSALPAPPPHLWVAHGQVFQGDGRDPLPARFYHIFAAIGDAHVTQSV